MEEVLGKQLIIPASARLQEAPQKTERYGKHYEHLIEIDKDHTASLVIDEEALIALRLRGKIVKYELSRDKKGLLGYFYDGVFYHIHSDELSALEKWIHSELLEKEV